jgi:hypothetical protein
LQELSIVVTCTGRKVLAPSPELHAGDLPDESVSRRAEVWLERLHRTSSPLRALRELYKGEAWQQSLELERRATLAGFKPVLYVASAGLGLRRTDSKAPGYSATFTMGHADSVAANTADAARWWGALCEAHGVLKLSSLPDVPTLVVLSAAYAGPLRHDVADLARKNPDVLVVGGGAPVPGTKHLTANRALRFALGGSAMSINQRIAGAWIDRLGGRSLTTSDAFAEWDSWVAQVQRVESWDRHPMSDDAVTAAIRSMLTTSPSIAWSPALRALRSSGFACEQKRFKNLFTLVTEASSGQ